MIDIIVYYIIPPVALGLSILFYLSARNNSKRAEKLLEQVSNASQTWQNDIMKFASELLNSSPNIVGQKAIIAKINAAQELSPKIDALVSSMNDPSLTEEQKESKRKDLKLLLDYSYHFLQSVLGSPPVITTQQKLDKVDDKEKPKQ